MSATEGSWPAEGRVNGVLLWPIAQGFIASIFLAFGLAAFLLVRRATGALTAPLPPLPLLVTAVAMLGWVWAVRYVWASSIHRGVFSARSDRFLAVWLPALTLIFVAVACSYPGRRAVDWLVWLPVIVANSIGPHVAERRKRLPAESAVLARRTSADTLPMNPIEPLDRSSTLLQQLSRSRDTDGRETIQGTIVAEFAAGERVATLHIAFCPPFESLPQVEAEIANGPDGSVKVAQVLHNGARLDVRLPQAAIEAVAISLEFAAQETVE
jgi:hypothetical protein